MLTYRKIFFLFISLFLLAGCRTSSNPGQRGTFDRNCFRKFVPEFQTQWYTASVDVTGTHFSGLLLFKTLADNSVRIAFTSEAGTTFFDFEFVPDQEPRALFALPQMNRGPVIRTLLNDLELVLMKYEKDPHAELYEDEKSNYLKVPKGRKTIYLTATRDCLQLLSVRQEWGGKKKVEVAMTGYSANVPDSISIIHHNFNMQIKLRKLQQ